MNVNAEKMEKQEMNMPYDQPSLKKYGTMKEFTLGSSGSHGDGMGPYSPNSGKDFTENPNIDYGTEAVNKGNTNGREDILINLTTDGPKDS
jgi:hypothetical protein